MTRTTFTLFDPKLVKPAIRDSFVKLDPRVQWRNPVMFVVYIGSIITSLLFVQALTGKGEASAGFILAISLWLWFTVLFANFAEALAEGRSKAQAASLRSLKKETWAKKLEQPVSTAKWLPIESQNLRKGDAIYVIAGDVVPADGEVIEGVASVDESAITGESGRDLRRPHDRNGRKRQAPEDAQRNRLDDPAGGADDRVSGRHRHAAAVFAVQRGGG
jgi:K+-transporting ATPase ATPase B chain